MTGLPVSYADNAARIEGWITPIASACAGRTVFLVDGDRTLSPDDTSRSFLRSAGGDPSIIKERFQRDGYCFEAFRYHAEVHLALGAEAFDTLAPSIARNVPLYEGAIDFLRDATEQADVFVLSAGVPRIWRALLDRHGLRSVRVLGGIEPTAPFVFGRSEKGLVARLFRAHAAALIGVGDSDVDRELLLTADHAVIVVDHRRNQDLLPHLRGHRSLWQIVPQGLPHEGIPQLDFLSILSLPRMQ